MPWKLMFERKRIIPLLLFLTILAIIWIRRHNNEKKSESNNAAEIHKTVIKGEALGTYYQVVYTDSVLVTKEEVDSVLQFYNHIFSNYDPTSEVSLLNGKDTSAQLSAYNLEVINASRAVFEITGGAFDPTVSPLISAWGFGPEKPDSIPPKKAVDSLLNFVGYNKIQVLDSVLIKPITTSLNFSAIAKGYIVDQLAAFVRSKGINSFMVEIGGEVVCGNPKSKDNPWKIGINDPNSIDNKVFKAVKLDNIALATSGNYRNYYMKDGVKYAHTIDPKTGYHVQHSLLSASVLAPDCMTADAFATAFMVLGVEASKKVLQTRKELDVYFIYHENGVDKTFATEGFQNRLIDTSNE